MVEVESQQSAVRGELRKVDLFDLENSEAVARLLVQPWLAMYDATG